MKTVNCSLGAPSCICTLWENSPTSIAILQHGVLACHITGVVKQKKVAFDPMYGVLLRKARWVWSSAKTRQPNNSQPYY